MTLILKFSEIRLKDIARVGGKNASLGEMITQLNELGIKVPRGFATTAEAYKQFISDNNIEKTIYSLLEKLDTENIEQLKETHSKIKTLILEAPFSKHFETEISTAYEALKLDPHQTVAVRSSATAEDLPDASFAGQQETFLNVSGIDQVLESIKKVYASLFTERAIVYRVHHKFHHHKIAISAGIQRMVRSDIGASGVAFTLDTESGFDQVIFITSSYGLGETVVQGSVNPDEFYCHKPTLEQGKKSIISRQLGSKEIKMIFDKDGTESVKTVDVPESERHQFSLNDDDILKLAKQAYLIEQHYKMPMDIEWGKDGIDQEIYILQARPETVKAHEKHQYLEQYQLIEKAEPLVSGRSVGQKIGQGVARLVKDPKHMDALKQDEILVTDMTDPDWNPIMKRAAAVVTNRGGRTCHAAIVAREMGIPAIVGCGNATTLITDGDLITVDCSAGESGSIYPGKLKYSVEKTEIENLPEIPVKLCMNLANPEQAFTYQFLPNDGVGLARLEFIIGSIIGIHPNAVLQFNSLPKSLQNEIQTMTSAYQSPTEFYIEKLAEGVATIAAAFYPKPVIVRFSDFKSNEYINLLGGEHFEPKEENPMLGYRGGSRYVSPDFKESFALECNALIRVREEKGLNNAHVMFPFVRTVEEAKSLVDLTQHNGLIRGKEGLNFYMMCEVPTNVLLAEEFLEYFDGYSIGSNDLTQLTMGLDRDSALISDLFDERNLAVKSLLHSVIQTCNKMDKYVGICGQGPSDHPDFAKWLMDEGIQSMSLTPDSIVKTRLALGKKN